MSAESHDPRNIPILTETIGRAADDSVSVNFNAVHAAILTETLKLAETLLRQAARDIEATLFERVFDRLRAELPELVDRVLHEHVAAAKLPAETGD